MSFFLSRKSAKKSNTKYEDDINDINYLIKLVEDEIAKNKDDPKLAVWRIKLYNIKNKFEENKNKNGYKEYYKDMCQLNTYIKNFSKEYKEYQNVIEKINSDNTQLKKYFNCNYTLHGGKSRKRRTNQKKRNTRRRKI